jgi:hypothetical protein
MLTFKLNPVYTPTADRLVAIDRVAIGRWRTYFWARCASVLTPASALLVVARSGRGR